LPQDNQQRLTAADDLAIIMFGVHGKRFFQACGFQVMKIVDHNPLSFLLILLLRH
jgi:hypothetical protein